MSKYYASISKFFKTFFNISFNKNLKKYILKKIKKLKKFTSCLLKHCKMWKYIWPITALKAASISRKLEIAQNAKSCSKRKTLLEIRKVAEKVAEQLMASPSRNHHVI